MTQQVGASEHQRLGKQLERLKGIEKSEIRMIEADRQRFRMRYRKRDFPKALTVKDAKINDPAILDDARRPANNGNQSARKFVEEGDYEAVRSLIFTGGKVDLDKILCLHLLTCHVVDIDEAELEFVSHKNEHSPVVDAEESENDILPCYVVEIQRDESSSSSQFHKRLAARQEELSQPEGQLRYRQSDAAAAEGAFRSLARGMPAPSAAGKMPIVSPRLYNNLLESHARRGNANASPSLEHLQKYIHTGQMFNKFDEKTADNLQRVQSSCRRAVCKNEKYFMCADEPFSAAPKSPKNRCRPILICIHTQLKSFVRTVVDILRNINREKANTLSDMLKSAQTVTAKLSEMQDFVNSLENFSFVSLPESFTCVPGYATEDAQFDDKKIGKKSVAETLIVESADVSVFDNLLENIRQALGDFWRKPSINSKSVDSLVDNASMFSVSTKYSIQTNNTVTQRSSKTSFSVGKSVEKIASNESSKKSYDSIQQEFNEAASARLEKNIKKNSWYTDPDHVILRRMTNSQRILVGQMCAALKTKKINNEGIVKEKIPLPALLKPVLSRESINYLTQGTIYAKDDDVDTSKVESKIQVGAPCTNLTDFILTKIYHEVLEVESRSQLQNFMNDAI